MFKLGCKINRPKQLVTCHLTYMYSRYHYNDVIMVTIASQITSPTIVYSTGYSDTDQRKHQLKAPLHWPLCGNSPGTGEFPAQMAGNAENVSILWCHHIMVQYLLRQKILYRQQCPSSSTLQWRHINVTVSEITDDLIASWTACSGQHKKQHMEAFYEGNPPVR